ncbi:MAG: hypothetical protein GF392_06035 [Candidatus Omnitrophica bacterium]|nr:hypothetical protein [Candidatus Omnitrophota bacterium]
MATSCNMKKGDIYYCDVCGIEFRIHKECNELAVQGAACSPVICCGHPVRKKRLSNRPPVDDHS